MSAALSPLQSTAAQSEVDRRRAKIRTECDRRGLTVAPHGNAWWIVGPGVDILTVDLAHVIPTELDRYRTVGGRAQLMPR